MRKDTLGDRMKSFEDISRFYLTKGLPIIIRVDGKSFHTFTKGFQKPFDMILMKALWRACQYVAKNMQGCKVVYHQSDEMSFLLDKNQMSPMFENNVQKIVSVSASMVTFAFNKYFAEEVNNVFGIYGNDADDESLYKFLKVYKKRIDTGGLFDSRIFILPENEVTNYFIWRQQDAMRNSIQMVGRTNFSHKELEKKSCQDIKEMLIAHKDLNFDNIPIYQQRGACIFREKYILDNVQKTERSRWVVDENIPIFSEDRDYIEKFLIVEEEEERLNRD